jgi:transcriptional regulator with XRE-family HTH domain
MPKSISIDSRNLLDKHAESSEVHMLIKLGLDSGLSINELANLAQVSRMTITNWINGHQVREENIRTLKEGLKEKGIFKAESKKRFFIPELRNSIELQKAAEKEKNTELKKIALEEKRIRDYKNKVFREEYGREILEAAIGGETGYFAYDHTQSILSLEQELLNRGFGIEYEDSFEIEDIKEEFKIQFKKYFLSAEQKLDRINDNDLNHLRFQIIQQLIKIKSILKTSTKLIAIFPDCETLNNLIPNNEMDFKDESTLALVELSLTISNLPMFVGHKDVDKINQEIQSLLSIVQPFEGDEDVISKYYVSWSYPDDEYLNKDCINAKFIDWLSDLYGKELISKIFSLIESCDLDGKSEIAITVNEGRKINEYTDDERRKMLNILDVDVPFPISLVKDMFNILGYEVNFEKIKEKVDSSAGHLIIKWN